MKKRFFALVASAAILVHAPSQGTTLNEIESALSGCVMSQSIFGEKSLNKKQVAEVRKECEAQIGAVFVTSIAKESARKAWHQCLENIVRPDGFDGMTAKAVGNAYRLACKDEYATMFLVEFFTVLRDEHEQKRQEITQHELANKVQIFRKLGLIQSSEAVNKIGY